MHYSASAWGATSRFLVTHPMGMPMGVVAPEHREEVQRRQPDVILSPIQIHLDAGIAIQVNEDHRIRIATTFCAPVDRFSKKEAYKRLRKKIDLGIPQVLFWQGRYNGQADALIKSCIVPITNAFKGGLQLCLSDVFPNRISRIWEDVVAVRRGILTYLEVEEFCTRDPDFPIRSHTALPGEEEPWTIELGLAHVREEQEKQKQQQLAEAARRAQAYNPPPSDGPGGPGSGGIIVP